MGKSLHNRINRKELRNRVHGDHIPRLTLSFYLYTPFQDPEAFRNRFYAELQALGVLGRIYVAAEGINAQITLPEARVGDFKALLSQYPFFEGMRLNFAVESDDESFFVLTVKLKDKIVADGILDDNFDVRQSGRHLSAGEFNALTEHPDTLVVDMRNHYESEVGHFQNAILPPMETFREGLPMVAELLATEKEKHIVLYCTGGIRCEKASAYLKYRGFPNVYQLDGGIIEYTHQVTEKGLNNKFIGKNFVFDERLGERISNDIIATCHQCGLPADHHVNCANDACHLLFIQCPACAEHFHHCCSEECYEFTLLPEAERKEQRKHRVFNGTHFSKSKPGMLFRET